MFDYNHSGRPLFSVALDCMLAHSLENCQQNKLVKLELRLSVCLLLLGLIC